MSKDFDARLAEIEQREQAATPGPWRAADEHGLMDGITPAWCVGRMNAKTYLYDVAYISEFSEQEQADADFIAHAREDIPWLLSQLRDARAENERLRERADHNAVAVNANADAIVRLRAELAEAKQRERAWHRAHDALAAEQDEPKRKRCAEPIQWIECPTGGWWAHLIHPTDNHDAAEPTEEATE